MQSLPVVEHDVVEHLAARVVAIGEAFVVRQLLLERAEEAFHHRVVVGHAFATHAGHQAGLRADDRRYR